jgi:hypothetical protein
VIQRAPKMLIQWIMDPQTVCMPEEEEEEEEKEGQWRGGGGGVEEEATLACRSVVLTLALTA